MENIELMRFWNNNNRAAIWLMVMMLNTVEWASLMGLGKYQWPLENDKGMEVKYPWIHSATTVSITVSPKNLIESTRFSFMEPFKLPHYGRGTTVWASCCYFASLFPCQSVRCLHIDKPIMLPSFLLTQAPLSESPNGLTRLCVLVCVIQYVTLPALYTAYVLCEVSPNLILTKCTVYLSLINTDVYVYISVIILCLYNCIYVYFLCSTVPPPAQRIRLQWRRLCYL